MDEVHTMDINILLDNFAEPFIIVDADGRILLFSKKAQQTRYMGIERLIPGENIFEQAPQKERDALQWIIQDVIETKNVRTIENVYRHEEDNSTHFEITYSPLLNPDGNVQVCISLRDITKQKIFEHKITQVYNDLSSLIANANAIIFGIDSRGYITEWNTACARLSGFGRDEAYTEKVTELIIPKHHKHDFIRLMGTILQGNSISNHELSIITKHGTEHILLLNATPRVTNMEQVVGAFFVGQDVTELTAYKKSLEKKVEERTSELKEALKKEKEVTEMKSRFVSIASHEFRTPLASISFTAGFIKKYLPRVSREEINNRLESIEKNVHHMTALLNDVLTIGKAESGKIMVSYTDIPIQDFFQKLRDEVMHSTRYSHDIQFTCKTAVGSFMSDEKLLRNIFINLLTNAIKFSPEKKTVHFSIDDDAERLRLQVRDMGIGIKPDELEKVFEPFQRASNADGISGTGLGLSIVKKAVEMLDGKITVDSRPGSGSEFTVFLPPAIHEKNTAG